MTAVAARKPRSKTDLASLPNRIRELRLSRGMSLSELSDLTTFTRSELHKLEKGVRRLRTDHLLPLSTALGCQAEELLSRDMIKQLSGSRASFTFAAGKASGAAANSSDLPVYGAASGGQFNVDFKAVQAQVARPPQLANVPHGYAVYMPSNALEARVPMGCLCYVNPVVPVKAGDVAVFVNENGGPADVAVVTAASLKGEKKAHKVIGLMFN